MATGKYVKIEDALSFRLASLALSPTRRVAWPRAAFDPVVGEIYLAPTFFPNGSDLGAVGINAPRRHRGIYQVTTRGPKTGPLTLEADEVADLVIEHFAQQTITQGGLSVRIGSFDGSPSVPSRSRAIEDGVWRAVPVSIPWWCDTFQ